MKETIQESSKPDVKGYFISPGSKLKLKKPDQNVLWTVVIWLLIVSAFERSGYYWATCSMVAFFTSVLGMEKVHASNMQAIFQAIVYIVPIIISILVDSIFGRFITIPIAIWGSFIGLILLIIAAVEKINWLTYIALFLFLAIFDASIKPTLMTLAGDQFDLSNPSHAKQKGHMFQFYYWFTNVAAGTAFLVAPYISTNGLASVTIKDGFLCTFIVSAFCYGASGSILTYMGIVRKSFYVRGASGSVVPDFVKCSWRVAKKDKRGMALYLSTCLLFFAVVLAIPNMLITNPDVQTAINYVLGAFFIICFFIMIVFGNNTEWVTRDVAEEDRKKMTDFASIWRLLPYVALCLPFWGIYNQMNTNFLWQSCQYNNYLNDKYDIGNASSNVWAAASMSAFNSVVIIIMIPILDYLVFPGLKKIGIKDTVLRRMGIGLAFAGLGVGVAAIWEILRRDADLVVTNCNEFTILDGWCNPAADYLLPDGSLYQTDWTFVDGVNDIESFYKLLDEQDNDAILGHILPIPPGSTKDNKLAYVLSRCGMSNEDNPGHELLHFIPLSDTSIFLMIVPLGIVGIGEILFAAVCTDFFYSQVPPEIRAIMQSINMLTVSIGTLLGAIIDVGFKDFITDNLDRGHLEYDYLTNVGLTVITLAAFIFRSRTFIYREEEKIQTTNDDDSVLLESSSTSSSSNSDSSPVTKGEEEEKQGSVTKAEEEEKQAEEKRED